MFDWLNFVMIIISRIVLRYHVSDICRVCYMYSTIQGMHGIKPKCLLMFIQILSLCYKYKAIWMRIEQLIRCHLRLFSTHPFNNMEPITTFIWCIIITIISDNPCWNTKFNWINLSYIYLHITWIFCISDVLNYWFQDLVWLVYISLFWNKVDKRNITKFDFS